MTGRIFRAVCLAAVSVFVMSMALVISLLYDYFTDVQIEQLTRQAQLAARGIEEAGDNYFESLPAGARLTWIGADGTVLHDTQAPAETMENHLDRAEVIKALESGSGSSVRRSSTITQKMLYAAVRAKDGTVVRVSDTQYSMPSLLFGLSRQMLITALLGAALSLYLASRLSKRIVKPLNELPLDGTATDVYNEIRPLMNRLSAQQGELRRQRSELEKRKSEFEAAASAMSEGVLLTDENGEILSINASAIKLRGLADNGKLCAEVKEAALTAASGKRADGELSLDGAVYRISAAPVENGAVILLTDITQQQRTERQRKEFTANVSHELKTPLHTIAGCAEMLAGGMVKTEDIPEFSGQILKDARRMSALVEDIIRLSRLDEGAEGERFEDVDLFEAAMSAARELEAPACAADVRVNVSGEHAHINGIPHLIALTIRNLMDNAIKYNRTGGSVDVNVSVSDSGAALVVSDTGIGIPEDEQERVFERFYRVNKSRSRELGGTGLGLSIVKHAAIIHGAKLDLHSKAGEGTRIEILFNMEKN